MGSHTNESYDDVLMQRLDFDSTDLDANRSSRLTARQKRRVWRWQLGWSVVIWGSALFVVWLGRTDFLRETGAMRNVLWFAVLAALILGAFWFQGQTFRILASGTICGTTGPINRRVIYGKSNTYFIGTPEKEFTVTADIYNIFSDGQDYTLYYVPEIDYLLSADFHPAPEIDYSLSPDSRPVPHPVVIEPQAPLLEHLNHVLNDKFSSSLAPEIAIWPRPLLKQINDLVSTEHDMQFGTTKKKARKRKGR